jgi:hypothetical protein
MASRSPTSNQRKMLRRLYAAAGSKRELNRWRDEALAEKPKSRGRKPMKFDAIPGALVGLEALCRFAEIRGMSRTAFLRLFVSTLRDEKTEPAFGRGELTSTVARLHRNLKAENFSEREVADFSSWCASIRRDSQI